MADLQEVQTAVDITPENTLETIEAIWTSSRKIIIGRQTRWIVQWWSWISMQNSVYLEMHAWDETDDLIWTLTVFDAYWDLFYQFAWDAIRIPEQWNYAITITPADWSNSWYYTCTTKVWAWNEVIYSYLKNNNTPYSETINVTLGKFTLIKLTIKSVAYGATSWTRTASLTIKKL